MGVVVGLEARKGMNPNVVIREKIAICKRRDQSNFRGGQLPGFVENAFVGRLGCELAIGLSG